MIHFRIARSVVYFEDGEARLPEGRWQRLVGEVTELERLLRWAVEQTLEFRTKDEATTWVEWQNDVKRALRDSTHSATAESEES